MLALPPRLFNTKNLLLAGGVVLAAIVTLVVRATFLQAASTAQPSTATRQAPAAVVQTAPARQGPISSVFSYAGAVQAAQQVNLVPRTSGIVKDLPVDVGTLVRRGQVVATLDAGNLPDQLVQAQASLDLAQARLDQLRNPKLDDVAAARAQLDQARARLDGLRTGRTEDVQNAVAALDAAQARLEFMEQGGRVESIAQAQADLDGARAKLALTLRGALDDARQAAVSAVESSRASVAAADLALANFAGTNVADLGAAQSAVEASRAAATTADTALTNLQATYNADVQAAQSAYDAAASQYNALRLSLDPQMSRPTGLAGVQTVPQSQISDAQAKVAAAQATLQSAQSNLAATRAGVGTSSSCALSDKGILRTPDACTLAINAAQASVDSATAALANAQANLDALNKAPPMAAIVQSRPQLDQAFATLENAQAKLDAVKGNTLVSRQAQAQAALDAARERLGSDQARLAALQSGGTASQRAQLQNQLVAAQEKLKSDQAKLDEINKGPQPEDVQQAEAAVRSAEQRLALAVAPSSEQDIRAQRATVEQARQQLQKALLPASPQDLMQQEQVVAQFQAQLQSKINPSPEDLRVAVASVDQARGQLAAAQTNLDQMVLTAPFDGAVGQKLLAVGAFAAPQTPILTLVGTGIEVHITVEEARVGAVGAGQLVQLTVPAYTDATFTGRVLTVAPAGDPRAHTFDVTIIPDGDDGRLLPGMFAQVKVTAREKASAVLVQRDALVQKEGEHGGYLQWHRGELTPVVRRT